VNPSGGMQVDVMTSPDQQQESASNKTDQSKDSVNNREENKNLERDMETCENQDEMSSKRTVKLSEHSLTVVVTENASQMSDQSKPSMPNRRSRRSMPSKGNLTDVPSTSIKEEMSAKSSREVRIPDPDTFDDSKRQLTKEEEITEVFVENTESSPATKRKSRRSVRMRPDFNDTQDDLTAEDKENSKPKRNTRCSLTAVDCFKLPSASMSAKRSKPKQRRHTVHVARSPEEWSVHYEQSHIMTRSI
jgi:hypothetical protein